MTIRIRPGGGSKDIYLILSAHDSNSISLSRLRFLPSPTRRNFNNASLPLQWIPTTRLGTVNEWAIHPSQFVKARPVLMPECQFQQKIPAITKWFKESGRGSHSSKKPVCLNRNFLSSFRETILPLEYSQLSSNESQDGQGDIFHRAEAPFGLFLDWAENATAETSDRLYLAQAPSTSFPPILQGDIPTPIDLLRKFGKGDVYDTNIWMGFPPTYTPLHSDPNPNLLVQLAGSKVVRLLSPNDGLKIYQECIGNENGSAKFRGDEMMTGNEKGLLEARIWCDQKIDRDGLGVGYEARLECGDGIYIPQGWWHSIKGVGNGITASVSEHTLLIALCLT